MILMNIANEVQRKPNRKNEGANPYQQNAAGLLQQYMAQQVAQNQLNQLAATKNQQESGFGGMSSSQFKDGFAKLKEQLNPTVKTDEDFAPLPAPPSPEMIAPPEGYGMSSVGNMERSFAPPSQSFKEMLPQLSSAAKLAYPDNPMMQQVALSQAILESGLNGRASDLATKHNNYFGIKASRSFPGTGGTVDMPTTEYVGGSPATMNQGFATNRTMGDSFLQHANLMTGANRYSPVLQSKTPGDAFTALQRAGYATDPNYASKLRAIHGRYVAPMYGNY